MTIRRSIVTAVLFLFLGGAFVMAQAPSKKENKKTQHKADDLFDKGEYFKALQLFEQLLKTDSMNYYYNYYAGVCKFNLKHLRKQSLKHLLLAHNRISYDVHYYLGSLYLFNGELEAALKEFSTYLSCKGKKSFEEEEITRQINKCLEAQKRIANPNRTEVLNLGAEINSDYPDYVPLISADGKTLFFTSRRPGATGNQSDIDGEAFEDIYEANYDGKKWSSPKNSSTPLNTADHDACVGLSPEGHSIMIYRSGKTPGSGDILSADFDGSKWTTPVLMDKEIDSDKWLEPSACYSADRTTIYFSSNRPGGYGGKDLYEVSKLPNGKWGKAVNLGPTVNTVYDEDAPFMHPDGKRLYFSSTGHENMGGYDVFYTLMDSVTKWSKPVNMGYPLNTVDDDIYFVVAGDGNVGYISSDREGGFGETDIYKVNLHENDLIYYVHTGYVKGDDGKALESKLTLIDDVTNKVAGIFKSNHLSGKFVLLMAPDREYTVLCETDGYHSESIHMVNKEQDFTITLKKQ